MSKAKSIVRKLIYFILFAGIIYCFIYLSNKYANNSDVKEYIMVDYYSDKNFTKFEAIKGAKMIRLLKDDYKHLIMIGSSKSEYSQKYIEELNSIIEVLDVDKVYYYDSYSDKSQKNSNYYEIRKLLSGNLSTSDGSNDNLLSPSFYIIDDGKVKYYNIDTCIMKNTDSAEKYWTEEKEQEFTNEITTAINKYYLNK